MLYQPLVDGPREVGDPGIGRRAEPRVLARRISRRKAADITHDVAEAISVVLCRLGIAFLPPAGANLLEGIAALE